MMKILCLVPELTEGANQDAGINRYLCGLTLQPSEETGCGKIIQQLQQQVALASSRCSGNPPSDSARSQPYGLFW